MTVFERRTLAAAAFAVAIANASATARNPGREYRATEATVDRIMDSAIENISIRYELNDKQKEVTGEIMRTRVRAFIRDHERDIWPILRDLISTQFGGRPPDDERDAIRLGKAAGPLARLAQQAILEGNAEWRKYLNDDQKKLHDFDLAEMDETFKRMDGYFEQWAQGSPMDRQIFERRPQSANALPPRPIMPPPGELPGLTDPAKDDDWPKLSFLDTMVAEFIKSYKLDKGQIESARSILNETKAKAGDFKTANRPALRAIARQLREVRESRDQKKTIAVEAKRKELLKPIYTLVSQMNGRLKLLLTKNQIQKHETARRTAAADSKKGKSAEARTESPKPTPPRGKAHETDKAAPSKAKSGEG